MEIFISFSATNKEYIELCELDKKIRSEEAAQVEWTPGMIFASEESLKYPRRLRRMLCRRIGLENISGPFLFDGYFDGDKKYTELPE